MNILSKLRAPEIGLRLPGIQELGREKRKIVLEYGGASLGIAKNQSNGVLNMFR